MQSTITQRTSNELRTNDKSHNLYLMKYSATPTIITTTTALNIATDLRINQKQQLLSLNTTTTRMICKQNHAIAGGATQLIVAHSLAGGSTYFIIFKQETIFLL